MIYMKPVIIDNDNFEQEVLNFDGTVLCDFWASWCGPCMMLAPTVEEFARNNPDIKVAKIDVDKCGELAAKYGIMSIPTLMVFKGGEVVNTSVGGISEDDISELVK